MKKIFVLMMAVALTIGLSFSVQAANQCQVTLTSPTIVKTGCEKVGSVTFSFDAGTVLTTGDWWYMDLPPGATICQTLDYFIFNAGAANGVANFGNIAAGSTSNIVYAGAANGIFNSLAAVPVGTAVGPFTVSNTGAVGGNLVSTGNVAFRVQGTIGTQRVWVRVLQMQGDAVRTTTVGASSTLELKILDGALHNTTIRWDSDGSGNYGDAAADTLQGPVPDLRNTLCVNAEQMSGTLMFVSFASLIDFINFTGDAQIAHAAAAQPLSLAFCKGETTGNILIAAQGGCRFDFETPLGYCPAPPALFVGNMLFIEGTTTFGDPGDRYDIRIYSDTAGVYFAGAPAVQGFIPADDKCTATGNAVGAAYIPYNESGTANVAYAGGTCSVGSTNRVREIRTINGAIAGIDIYDALWINLPNLVYDTSIVGDGTQSVIRVALHKYPCGEIFSGSHTVGTLVTTCPVGVGGTTLLFPFLPAMDGSYPGWWGGFMIVNGSTAAGTAVLTFTEADGDTATYTTPSIPAAGQWTAAASADLLTMVTPGAGNTGTFGDANVSVVGVCAFNLGGGFAFTGNLIEGTGYTAYVLEIGRAHV